MGEMLRLFESADVNKQIYRRGTETEKAYQGLLRAAGEALMIIPPAKQHVLEGRVGTSPHIPHHWTAKPSSLGSIIVSWYSINELTILTSPALDWLIMSHEYVALVQDDELVDKESGGLAPPQIPVQLHQRSSKSSLSLVAVAFVVLVVLVNAFCVTTSWRRVDAVYEALKGQLDFRDTRELPRPNTDTYYGD